MKIKPKRMDTIVYWVVPEIKTNSAVIHIETPEKVDHVIINSVKFKLVQENENEKE